MNREEFIKHQEDMINELFPPEHRREVAECAQDMLADACKEMERWHGKDWRENAKVDYDPKTAFLTELSELLRKYNAVINVGWDDFYEGKYPKIDMDIVFCDGSGMCFESVLGKSLTSDNIFDYKKKIKISE